MSTNGCTIFEGRVAGATQVERTCKAILRTIWAQGLKAGDRLPNHRDLVASLGVSNNTMDPAMRRLVETGVITRRPKTGTVVLDPDAFTESLWRVGVLENFDDMRTASPYWSLLGAFVQHDLANAGCWPRLYFHRIRGASPPLKIGDYRALREDVDRGRLDGAVCLGSMDLHDWHDVADGLPLCGFHESFGSGVVVDGKAWRLEARELFGNSGCCRIGDFEGGDDQGGFPVRLDSGEKILVVYPRPAGSTRAVYHMDVGRAAAQTLLRLPKSRRPDGLMMQDDYMAAGFTQQLRESEGYRPSIAVLTHLQNPLSYALPILQFEVDISEMSRLCVAMLLERLRNPAIPKQIDRIVPRLVARAV